MLPSPFFFFCQKRVRTSTFVLLFPILHSKLFCMPAFYAVITTKVDNPFLYVPYAVVFGN